MTNPDSTFGVDLGLSPSDWNRITQTQEAQDSIEYFIDKLKQGVFEEYTKAETLEDFLTLKGYSKLIRECERKLRKKRKDREERSKPTTFLTRN